MFPKSRKTKVLRILNLIGVFLIHIPSRPLLYLGNLAVYVPSYVILHTGQLSTIHVDQSSTNTVNDTHNYVTPVNFSSQDNNITYEQLTQHGIQKSWFVPVFSTAWMVGTFLGGALANYIRARFVIGLGIIFQSGAWFVSCFTINVSESAFFVMLCIFIGFGAGLYEGLLLKNYVVVRLNKRTGTITSLVLSSGPLGGVIINQFITWYTNPQNLSPDIKMGEMRIFSQASIQERIPSMFLILGSTMLGLTILGFLMLKERKAQSTEVIDGQGQGENGSPFSGDGNISCGFKNEDSNLFANHDIIIENSKSFDPSSYACSVLVNDSSKTVSSRYNINTISSRELTKFQLDDTNVEVEVEESGEVALMSNGECRSRTETCDKNRMEERDFGQDDVIGNDSTDRQNSLCNNEHDESTLEVSKNRSQVTMTALGLLKSVAFYKIAIVYIFGSSARLFLSVYFKIYGQEWIQDDHFLTNLAAVMSFSAVFTTVVWGLVLDKIGLKLCFIVIYTGISLFFMLMYFCAQLNKWAYFFVTLFNSSFVNYLYPVFTIALIKWFGRDYLSAKLGVVEIFSTAGYVLATFVLAVLMENYGYLSGFIWTSSVHLVGLIVIIATYPKA